MSTPSCSIKGIFCRFRLWSSSSQPYHQLRCSPLLPQKTAMRTSSLLRKRKSLVPVLTGTGRQVFLVDPHILDHWLFQDLLHKQGESVKEREDGREWEHDELFFEYARRKKRRPAENGLAHPIFLDCDAILFEFFLWLVENDDPSLRDLKLDDLMEFYGSES